MTNDQAGMIRRYRFYRKRMRIWPSVKRAWRLRHQFADQPEGDNDG